MTSIKQPRVVLFRGLPGVGKTYVSKLVAERQKWPVISKDDIYDVVYSSFDHHQKRNEVCYQILYEIINTNLNAGVDLIIDYPFRSMMIYRHYQNLFDIEMAL